MLGGLWFKKILIQTLSLSLSLILSTVVFLKDCFANEFSGELPKELPQYNFNPSDFYFGVNGTYIIYMHPPKNINDTNHFGSGGSSFTNNLNHFGYGAFLGYRYHLPANLSLGLDLVIRMMEVVFLIILAFQLKVVMSKT